MGEKSTGVTRVGYTVACQGLVFLLDVPALPVFVALMLTLFAYLTLGRVSKTSTGSNPPGPSLACLSLSISYKPDHKH